MQHSREDHIAMIRNPKEWPRWPVLPVKRWHGEDKQFGVILAASIHPNSKGPDPLVRLASMFDPMKQILNADKIGYSDIEAMVDDGWEVD